MGTELTPSPAGPPARPAEPKYDLLEELAATILEAAKTLSAALEGRVTPAHAWDAIRGYEHKGDAIARDLFETLSETKTGNGHVEAVQAWAQRDVAARLTGYLDDVLDAIEAAAARLAIHRIKRVLPSAREMGEVVLESTRELGQAIGQLRRLRDVFPHTRMLHRLENRGDDILRETIRRLFAGRASAKEIIKWKDICENLEAATDRCEDIANILETIVVQAGAEDTLAANRLVMRIEDHSVVAGDERVPLSAKEFDLLHLLMRHLGKIVRRERLLQEVWGADYFGDTRTLDTHIAWLRKKVEARGGVRIAAVRGIGYRLDLAE